MDLANWKRATIHIECVTEAEYASLCGQRDLDQVALLKDKAISVDDFFKSASQKRKVARYHGTAIYIKHLRRRYLVTARHVVHDDYSDKPALPPMSDTTPAHIRAAHLQRFSEQSEDRIFERIFRVPLLDEVIAGKQAKSMLRMLDFGGYGLAHYSFSKPDFDVAVISLDAADSRFADGLDDSGFAPIDSGDIVHEPDAEGQEIFTVGYPSDAALLSEFDEAAAPVWSTNEFSLPVAAFGRVSMLHPALHYFYTDMGVYRGNSGGPVVAGDRLVGVVSSRASDTVPFGKITKAKHVLSQLDQQVAKDAKAKAFWDKVRASPGQYVPLV